MGLNKKLGLGSVQFGVKYGIANKKDKTNATEVSKILLRAKEYGINLIDTAPAYGDAEYVLGKHNLKNFKVVSKFFPSDEKGPLFTQVERSLTDLRVKSLYGYLAHRPIELLESESDWTDLLALKKEKLVEKIGFSLNSPYELEELLEKQLIPDLIQIPFNLFDGRFRKYAQSLKRQGCEIHTRSSFLQGLFFTDVDNLPSFFDEVKDEINKLQQTFGDQLPGALLAYALRQEFIDYVIIGVEDEDQFLKNLNFMKESITDIESNIIISENILMPSNWPK